MDHEIAPLTRVYDEEGRTYVYVCMVRLPNGQGDAHLVRPVCEELTETWTGDLMVKSRVLLTPSVALIAPAVARLRAECDTLIAAQHVAHQQLCEARGGLNTIAALEEELARLRDEVDRLRKAAPVGAGEADI